MNRLIKLLILFLGVSIYSQDTLSVKDGAYGYDKDFVLDLHLTTESAIKALQFDLKYDGDNFNYKSSYELIKARLGAEDSDHVITLKEVKSGNLRILIYSPSNKAIPTGNGKLLSINFHNSKNFGKYKFELASVVASKEDNTNLTLKLTNGEITTLAPGIGWNSNSIDFGSVYKDEIKDLKWELQNIGTDTLNITLNKEELTKFSLTDWDSKTNVIAWPQKIYPGNKLEVNVRVNSSENGTFNQSLFLDSDDPVNLGTKEFNFKARIYNENRIVVQSGADAENKKTSDVKVSINGDEDITSFQFDIYPPDNNNSSLDAGENKVELISGSASLLKSETDHIISSNVRTDENGNKFLRVVAYSPSNALLAQPIGEIVKFSVRPDKILNPGSYPIFVKDIVLTNKQLTNVSSASENGSINLITGRLAFKFPPVTGDDSKRNYTLDLGVVFRNSYNEKTVPYFNSGNKKLKITGVTSIDNEVSISETFPLEKESNVDSNLNFKIVPSGLTDDFSSYLKFTHDGGSEIDSIEIKATLKNRNVLVMKNSNVSKSAVNSIPISMLNSNEIKGMQFDLTVPKETKSFTWTLKSDSNDDFIFSELSDAKDPGITHYVGDEIKFINDAGTTHPLFIVTALGSEGGYDSTKQLAGVTNQGATSGTVTVDLSEVSPGTYYYICGTHKSMQGEIVILPKFSIDAKSANLISERSADFTLTQSILGARKYRFLLFSSTNALFTGNNGAIINMPLELKKIDNETMAVADGSYQVTLDNIIISGKDNSNVASEAASAGTIVVGGVNEFDPVIDPGQTTTLNENPLTNTYFYKVKASDADENSFVDDFKIVSGNDDGTFGVVAETGDLYVIKPVNVDYETKKSFSIGVTVSDGTKTSAEETITINITDDPNAFVVNNFTVQVYRDNNKSGSYKDSDDIRKSSSAAASDFSYEIESGNDKDLFLLDSSTGKLTLTTAPVFSSPTDLDKNNIYELSIRTIVNDDTSSFKPIVSSEKTVSIKEDTTDALTIASILVTEASDVDGDGIIDSLDNCPTIANSNQLDHDKNGEGNVCEDSDGDGVLDYKDVCPIIPNADQADSDFDGIGDVCEDSDSDGVIDIFDNCPSVANLDQADMDGDGIGDVCDDDKDGDTILNTTDNCPSIVNTDQADLDKDGIGDVCDDDKDGDTILNNVDNCPAVANTNQSDIDGDGIGDLCDEDIDGDGKLNSEDNCPNVSNADQADMDGDGIGDVCDDDKDGDTILNDVDNCPTIANTDQADFDKDGIGDLCDSDVDGDGILNTEDDCANTPLGSVVDTKGCKVFTLPVNNNKVEITSATCIGTSDGSIGLSVEDNAYDYSITVTGKDDPIVISGENKTSSVTGLAKGTYSVCFKVTGQAEYEQCFEVVIGEPKALSAFIDVDNDKRTTNIQLGGSKSYNVDVNGERFKVSGDKFNTTLPTGLSIIKISTDLDCQGIIEREIFISEDIFYYPNPTKGEVDVFVNGEDRGVKMSVFTTKGDLVFTRDQEILDSRKTELDLTGVPAGTYLVTLEGTTVRKTFKIVKR